MQGSLEDDLASLRKLRDDEESGAPLPSAPSVTIGAVPPAKRHGAGLEPGPDTTSTSSASAIVDRAPDNFHLLALSLACAPAMTLGTAHGPGRHWLWSATKSAHSPHVTECADLVAGSVGCSARATAVPKVMTCHTS